MTFALRRTARDDYDVLQDGEIVERIYRIARALALDDARIARADARWRRGR